MGKVIDKSLLEKYAPRPILGGVALMGLSLTNTYRVWSAEEDTRRVRREYRKWKRTSIQR